MEYFVSPTGNMQNSVQDKVPILRCHSYYYTKAGNKFKFHKLLHLQKLGLEGTRFAFKILKTDAAFRSPY